MNALQRPACQITRERGGIRSAFTLFELLVVLVVVSLIAGLSWPRLASYLQENAVRSGAELVRTTVDQCRVKAVEDGIIYQFRYEPHGQRFLVLPYELVEEEQNQTSSLVNREKKTAGRAYQLGKSVWFYPPEGSIGTQFPTERLPEEYLALLDNGSLYRDVAWSPPILFYPDGSSTDQYFSVEDKSMRSVTLSIRSLTGTITASKLKYLSGGSRGR